MYKSLRFSSKNLLHKPHLFLRSPPRLLSFRDRTCPDNKILRLHSLPEAALLLLPLVFPVPIDGILFAGPIADGAAFLTSVLLVRHEMARIRQQELAQTQ